MSGWRRPVAVPLKQTGSAVDEPPVRSLCGYSEAPAAAVLCERPDPLGPLVEQRN